MSRSTPTLQKRHYELIASIIADLPDDESSREHVARHFAHSLRATNPQFHMGYFLEACKGTQNYRKTYNAS